MAGDADDTARLLERALRAADPWEALEELFEQVPDGLAGVVRERYRRGDREDRRRLAWLLGLIPVQDAVLDLLPHAAGDDAADLLRVAARRRLDVPYAELRRLLGDPAARGAAIDAAGVTPDPGKARLVIPLLREGLADRDVRGQAALALGRLRDTGSTAAIVGGLRGLEGLEHDAFVVALELMADETAIPGLLAHLRRVPDQQVWSVHHALTRLCRWEPLLPIAATKPWAAAARRAWRDRPAAPRARIEGLRVSDRARARYDVHDGQGVVHVDHDPPPPGSTWPRWEQSLHVDGHRTYRVGSGCGTCETTLHLLGWPPRPAAFRARRVREKLADVGTVTPELVETLEPLLAGLRSGHYLAVLADLDVEHVTDAAASWWWRRIGLRTLDPGDSDDETPDLHWPGTDHLQLRTLIPGPQPALGVVMPTQPLDAAAPGTVAAHTAAIEAGRRPAAVLLSWVEDRYVRAEHPERFLVSFVLDGHHKLLAYARAGVPARALLVCRLEDSWSVDDPAARIDEVTAPLLAGAGP